MNSWAAGALATVIAAALTYLGTRYSARSARDASRYSASVQAADGVATGYGKLMDDVWESVDDARRQARAERQRALRSQGQYRAAIAYIRTLLSLLSLHAPQVQLPQPPEELREDVRIYDPGT